MLYYVNFSFWGWSWVGSLCIAGPCRVLASPNEDNMVNFLVAGRFLILLLIRVLDHAECHRNTAIDREQHIAKDDR